MKLDFADISKRVNFIDLLDTLALPYTESRKDIKGRGKFEFIIDPAKNLFLTPGQDQPKGSVINFYSAHAGISLREAAQWLKENFLDNPSDLTPKCPDLELDYSHEAVQAMEITPETAKELEIGYAPGKSIMRGRVAFTIRDKDGQKVAYGGRMTKKGQTPYLFPKGFKYEHLYLLNAVEDTKWVILVPDWLDCVRLYTLYPQRVISTLHSSLSETQAALLRQFRIVYILNPEPDNWLVRVCKYSLTKAPKFNKQIREMSKDEIKMILH